MSPGHTVLTKSALATKSKRRLDPAALCEICRKSPRCPGADYERKAFEELFLGKGFAAFNMTDWL